VADDEPVDDLDALLAQGDIDALMQEAQSESDEVIYRPDGSRLRSDEKISIETYDFRNPVFLTEVELRQVRIRHENFVHYLAARLSMFLRMDFGMKMSKLYTAPYAKFIETIPNPTHIILFSIEQLKGVGIVDINPRLGLTIVNRMLGGQGHSINEERYLTEIEMALLDDVFNIVLSEWCRQWEEVKELNTTIIGRENNGRFLQTAPHDAIMLVLDIEAAIGDCSEMLQIGVPYYMIEPIIREMQARNRKFGQAKEEARAPLWLNSYQEINVPVYAEWDAFQLTVQDLLNLRPGDILELPEKISEKTVLRLRSTPRFKGEVGVENDRVAVRITERLDLEK